MEDLIDAVTRLKAGCGSRPSVIVAETIKGKGLGAPLEGSVASHHLKISHDDLDLALGGKDGSGG